MTNSGEPTQPTRNRYLQAYGLWASLIVIGMAVIFIWRETFLVLIGLIVGRQGANRAIFQGSIVILGFIIFLTVMGGESYLRGGVERNTLRRRFMRLAVPLVILGVVGLTIYLVIITFFQSQL